MKTLFAATLTMLSLQVPGQSGSVDPTFNSSDVVSGSQIGCWNYLTDMVRQPDGKHILFGTFRYDGVPVGYIPRISANGSLDPTFQVGSGPSTTHLLNGAVTPDGKVLVGGAFSSFNGSPRSYLVRLNADGSLDETFDASGALTSAVGNIAVQSDGRILVSSGTVKRLEANGALDATFNGPTGGMLLLASLSDGRVLVDGTTILNPDGSVDGSFAPDLTGLGTISSAVLQPDEKILIAGSTAVERFLLSGTADPDFSDGTGVSGGTIIAMAIEYDGSILLSTTPGYNTTVTYDGNEIIGLGRLQSDGTWQGKVTRAYSIGLPILIPQPDGRMLVGGSQFFHVNEQRAHHLAMLDPDGGLSLSFNTTTGFDDQVLAISVLADDAILVGGWFSKYNGGRCGRLIKLDPSGEIDPAFTIGTGANAAVLCIAEQPDGKLLVGGNFTAFNGIAANHLVRLFPNGELDESFIPALSGVGSVSSIAIQIDGKLVVGYNDRRVEPRYLSGSSQRGNIARLLPDGTLDTTFENRAFPITTASGSSISSEVRTIVVGPDGELWVGGWGLKFESGAQNHQIVRLGSDGQLDTGFSLLNDGFRLPLLNQAYVSDLLPDGDGGVLVGGLYSYYGTSVTAPIRLEESGAHDAVNFAVQSGTQCLALARAPNGGVFTGYTYVDATGVPFSSFNIGGGYENIGFRYPTISVIAFQSDGKAIVGGDFTGYDGVVRNRIARINLDFSTDMADRNTSAQSTYPVPSSSIVYIPTITSGGIHDVNGRCVMRFTHTNVLDISSLAPGAYVVVGEDTTPVRIVKE